MNRTDSNPLDYRRTQAAPDRAVGALVIVAAACLGVAAVLAAVSLGPKLLFDAYVMAVAMSLGGTIVSILAVRRRQRLGWAVLLANIALLVVSVGIVAVGLYLFMRSPSVPGGP